MRTFVYTDEKSNKFWNIELEGASFNVTFGKVGTKGQTQTKEFDDEEAAHKAHDKLVAEKLAKGYVETTAAPTAAPTPLQQSLEQALVENPDDLAAHSAYADYLMEHDDPRGECVQVQLSLEQSGRSPQELTQLRKREGALLSQHGRQWLGDVGRFLVGNWSGPDKPYHYEFRLGWLDTVRTLPFPDAIIAALARSPEARLLRRLEIVYDMRYHPFEFDQFMAGPNQALTGDENPNETHDAADVLRPLLTSPYLTNLRIFKLGFSDSEERLGHSTMVSPFGDCTVEQMIEFLTRCSRLEELYLNTVLPGDRPAAWRNVAGIDRLFAHPALGNLRVLQYYFGTDYFSRQPGNPNPLRTLATNPMLQRLTTLRLHPGRDTTIDLEEFNALLHSPHLPSLTHLQVHMTTFGDAGCRAIVQSGILRRLKVLDVGYGNMTDEGAALLAGCPDLKKLTRLDVSRNALSEEGIAALQKTGIEVVARDQHDEGEEDYLFEVDYE
jgi:uncharacterized protein (TIGR02996 family)